MISGSYFDGKTSNRQKVSLHYSEDGTVYLDGCGEVSASFDVLVVSPRIGNTARYIDFPGGSQFETDDNNAVDKMVEKLGSIRRGGFIHLLESRWTWVAALTFVVVFFGWVFVQYGIPSLSREISAVIPDKISRYMGQGVLEVMDKTWFEESTLSAQRQSELRSLFLGLLAENESIENVQMEFRAGGAIKANAFALPSGIIVMTDELIALAGNDQEILSIMLHELGHLEHRHSLRSAIQNFGLAMLVMTVTGDVSTSSSLITTMPVLLAEAGFSQDMEWEADTYTINKMEQYGIKPFHFSDMLGKLEVSRHSSYESCIKEADVSIASCLEKALEAKAEDETEEDSGWNYLSTHPGTKERMERFKYSESL